MVGWLLIVSTLVAYIPLRMSLVEMALPGIVAVDVESPSTPIPCKRTIEIGQADVLVILIGGQNAKTPVEGGGFAHIPDCVRLKNIKTRLCGSDIVTEAEVAKCLRE